jgi:hypothetical protein
LGAAFLRIIPKKARRGQFERDVFLLLYFLKAIMAHLALNIRSKVDLKIVICFLPKEPNFWFKMSGNSVSFFTNLCPREWELERRTQHGDKQTRIHPQRGRGYAW